MNEPQQNHQGLEMSDLPGANRRRRVPAFMRTLAARPALRMRLWQAGTVAIMLCLLFVVAPGFLPLLQRNLSSIFAHPTVQLAATSPSSSQGISQNMPSQFNTKKVIFWDSSTPPAVLKFATLDTAPQDCSQYTILQNFAAPTLPAGIGSSPLWVTGFTGPRATLNRMTRANPPVLGWYRQLQLVGETNYSGTITLQGGIVGSAFPLWFGYYPHGGELITTISLQPADSSLSNHTTDDQQWNARPLNLYIARSGCYYLQATWNGGAWTAYFAAGK